MADGKFVSYPRVSTDKQGRSGLGLEVSGNALDTVSTSASYWPWSALACAVGVPAGALRMARGLRR